MAIGVVGWLGKAFGALGSTHTLDFDTNGPIFRPPPVSGVEQKGARAFTDPTTPTVTHWQVNGDIQAVGGYKSVVGPFAIKANNLIGFTVNGQMCLSGTGAATPMVYPTPFSGYVVGISFYLTTCTGSTPTITLTPQANGSNINASLTMSLANANSGNKVTATSPYGTYAFNAGDNLTLKMVTSSAVTAIDCHAYLLIQH